MYPTNRGINSHQDNGGGGGHLLANPEEKGEDREGADIHPTPSKGCENSWNKDNLPKINRIASQTS